MQCLNALGVDSLRIFLQGYTEPQLSKQHCLYALYVYDDDCLRSATAGRVKAFHGFKVAS